MKMTKFLTATAIGGLISAMPAYAQDIQEEEAIDDNVIIVTASKRETTLQETPIAVSVTGKAQIEEAQVRDLLDLQTLVPSLRVNQLQSSANTNFIIRGFGNGANNAGIEPSVGVFIDGVYRSRSAAAISDLPNLQRVEVLRGPQSTLFGKNASAGIISIITQKPQFEFGGKAELSYGNFNAIIAKADVTGPISETIAFSLSGNYNKRDGYVQDLALGQDSNERNRWGVRGQLLFEPNADLSFRFIADYDKIDEDCCSVVNVFDGPTGNAVRALGGQIDSNNRFSRVSFLNFASTNEIENYGVSLQTDYSTGAFNITAIGAYRAVRSDTNADSDFTSADLIGSNRADTSIDTYTMELRVASDFDGFFNFLVGGYYFKEDIGSVESLTFGADFANYADLLSGGNYTGLEPTLRFLIPTIPAGSFGGQGQGRFEDYDYSNNSFSIFGQVDFDISDRLTFTAGGNYTSDRKRVATNNISTDVFSSIDLVQAGVLAGVPAFLAADPNFNPFLGLQPLQFIPGFPNFPNAVENGRTKDTDFSYTLRLAYEISDNFNAYATYATGFKASSFNLSTDSRPTSGGFCSGIMHSRYRRRLRRLSGQPLAQICQTTSHPVPALRDRKMPRSMKLAVKGQFDGFAFNLAICSIKLSKASKSNVFTGTGFVLGNAEQQSTFGVEFDASFKSRSVI